MTGSLGHLLYVYANFALGVACNPPYLAHVTLLSAGPPPELLDVCTTTVTYSLDLAVITPPRRWPACWCTVGSRSATCWPHRCWSRSC